MTVYDIVILNLTNSLEYYYFTYFSFLFLSTLDIFRLSKIYKFLLAIVISE